MGVILASMSLTDKYTRSEEYELSELGGQPNSPFCLQMYTSIEKYSEMYNVPKYIAYNVAYLETRYQGPFHWRYDHRKVSSAGAQGPMQIITRWAHSYAQRRVGERELRNNIDLNVKISMKMLRARYDMTHDWMLACGGYNTGSPVRNSYAVFAATNKNYKNNWLRY
jgi:soluble lytic murein transglycosylase-like protein